MVRKISLMAAAALALSGCTTIQSGAAVVGDRMCANRATFELAYAMMMQNAAFVSDPVIRQGMISAAQAGLQTLAACPSGGGTQPVSVEGLGDR